MKERKPSIVHADRSNDVGFDTLGRHETNGRYQHTVMVKRMGAFLIFGERSDSQIPLFS
jgi:hypothetical protein